MPCSLEIPHRDAVHLWNEPRRTKQRARNRLSIEHGMGAQRARAGFRSGPNNTLHLTAYSVRSCVALALKYSSQTYLCDGPVILNMAWREFVTLPSQPHFWETRLHILRPYKPCRSCRSERSGWG